MTKTAVTSPDECVDEDRADFSTESEKKEKGKERAALALFHH